MHGCTSGPMLLVNAELDSMGGFGINSTSSLHKSSDLEKTQAELRQTFTTAEKFRSELEYLQKGGDPLDLKPGNAASLTNRHPEQFVTSEAKCRLGAPLSCEPNSADNLMLLKESGNSTVLEIPKKSYKRRVRTRPNRDPFRHVSRDLLNSNSTPNPKSPNELDGVPAVQSKALTEPESVGNIKQVNLPDSKCPNIPDPTKILDAESSCTQNSQRFVDFNGNGQPTTGQIEQNIEMKKDIADIKEEKPNIVVGPTQDENVCNNRPQGSSGPHLNPESNDGAEQNACSQDNLKLAVKEHEDSILEEARIIQAKRKRITELSDRTLPPEKRLKSQWDFVLEEMSWLANDFAQEHLWKVTAAAQISQQVAFASRVRLQQQSSLQKHKQVSHTLAESVMEFWHTIQVKCKEKDDMVGVQGYAIRFMEYNNSCQVQWDPPQAHDTVSDDLVSMDPSWEDNLTEENLFYTVPPGAIEAYRKAIDSHLLQFERTGNSMQEEVDTSGYDAVADNTFEEDEGETNTYYLPGAFEANKSTNTAQKRRKKIKLYGPKSFEKTVGKRSGNSLNVCTASRQRFITPFSAGTSSGDNNNNSFQDEQSGGSHVQNNNNMEAESVGDYEKQLHLDSMEGSNRPKKKKKAKHPGSMFRNRWQLESTFQNDQKDYTRRVDTHQFDSNGSNVASQMSNMSNSNKFMKLLVRDRGRKVKALKNPVGQPDSGSQWSLFEDQALVVLVHDMGPNWELITDAINSTLQFKCIFRKSEECKERHGILMDINNGDSGEDSGSSQPYPSTLPRIPEGSARQLFQRLQGPMEEDTLKSHFEKIIMIGQKQHCRRTHNDNQDPKQLQQPHKSHAISLSQIYPNNLTGGPILTPLELCEAVSSSPDVAPVGYQGPHSGGLPGMNHGSVPPAVPGSGSGSGSGTSAPGSSNSVHGSHLPSASAPLNPSVREGRYGIPRTGSLSVKDQQYYQMLSAKQSGLPGGPHSVTDRGVRMLPAGNGMCGVNRNMKMTRPGFPASTSMLTSGQGNSMLRPRDRMHMIRPNQNTDQVSQSGPTQSFPPQQSYRPPNNTQHPALAIRFAKERQLQQRLLFQQQFSTSTPVMPPVQPDSQLPVSSPQNTTPPVRPPPPHGLPQTRPRLPHQLPPQLMKGGVMNGFSGGQQSSLSQPYQQKTFSGQMHKSTDTNNNNKNQVKLVNQKQATATTPQKVLLNRKVNMSDQSTSKQTESTQTNSTGPPVVSSGDAGTHLGKNPVRVGPPQAIVESENSGPVIMSQVTDHRQSSSDKLVNSVGNDEGVQWQQHPPS